MTYSTEFANTLATIAAKAARKQGKQWTAEQCVDFAWFSVNSVGDASIDDEDFNRHVAEYAADFEIV